MGITALSMVFFSGNHFLKEHSKSATILSEKDYEAIVTEYFPVMSRCVRNIERFGTDGITQKMQEKQCIRRIDGKSKSVSDEGLNQIAAYNNHHTLSSQAKSFVLNVGAGGVGLAALALGLGAIGYTRE